MIGGVPFLFLSLLARVPIVLGSIAMIVGYHFWGATGFFVALTLFILVNMLAARLRQDGEAAEELRERAERARFQEPPPLDQERDRT